MNRNMLKPLYSIAVLAALTLASCNPRVEISGETGAAPEIFPDYSGITVPKNIAPLNFNYLGEEDAALIVRGEGAERLLKARGGLFKFSPRAWKSLMKENEGGWMELTVAVKDGAAWKACKSFKINVSADEIDPYLSYRLIPPGYQAWKKMGIYQRNLETYSQTAIYENTLTSGNCVNCHTPWQRDPSRTLFHLRSDYGGTAMIIDGKVEKLNTKTDSTISALVYPFWHPSGRFAAFSVNTTQQNFFSSHPNRIEVYDQSSDVVVYDVENHSILWSPLTKSPDYFETFPAFSPDGKYLYFCSAEAVSPMPERYADVHYNLCRISFDAEDANSPFGSAAETVLDAAAMGKSVSFPRISPDGKYLVFTLHDFGNFSIWHKEADLWALSLESGEIFELAEANSSDVDSYHTWSGNSRWMVFSSRRGDGLHTRPYICHIDENGKAGKAFLLPQKNPLEYYSSLMVSYNIPELMSRKATFSERKVASAMRNTEGVNVTAEKRHEAILR